MVSGRWAFWLVWWYGGTLWYVPLLLLWHQRVIPASARVVSTKYGLIRGRADGSAFLGVPYASAPLGALRFMPPVTPPHWRGVRSAEALGPACPQRLPEITNTTNAGRRERLLRLAAYVRNQSEDCLFLNVYVPTQPSSDPGAPATVPGPGSRLAVILFIHGESYDWNSGNAYDGSTLANFGNVIVITLNFRLGVLGWLPPMEGATRGNYGLLDQVAALHWIQENIEEFGGDPHNVTVMGQGQGAASAHLLTFSPMAKGLFHRVILQSGSALSPWAIARDPYTYTRQLARLLGCPPEEGSALVECIRQLSVSDILRVELLAPAHLTVFGPTVDGVVLPRDPLVAPPGAASGDQQRRYDVLFGVNRMESYLGVTAREERYGMEPERRDRLLRTLVRNLYQYHLQEILLTIVNEYTDWTRQQHPVNVMDGLLDALGDALVVAPLIKAFSGHPLSPRTFFYVFGYQTEGGPYPQRLGCLPGEELPYMLGAPLSRTLSGPFAKNYTKMEVALAEGVMTYWSNFAKTGDPNSFGHSSETDKSRGKFERVLWPPYDGIQQKYLMIGTKAKVRDHYHAHRLSIWLHLIPRLHRSGGTKEHHLLDDHDNALMYEGIVRPFPPAAGAPPSIASPATLLGSSSSRVNDSAVPLPTSPRGPPPPQPPTANLTDSLAVVLRHSGYSTALSVTIAVGCSLLVLNVLIFAGVYYQRDKHRLQAKLQKRSYKMQKMDSSVVQGNLPSKAPPLDAGTLEPPGFSPPPPVMDPSGAPKVPPKPPVVMPEAQPLLSHGVVVKPVPAEMRTGPPYPPLWTGENVITV